MPKACIIFSIRVSIFLFQGKYVDYLIKLLLLGVVVTEVMWNLPCRKVLLTLKLIVHYSSEKYNMA